MNRIKQNIDFLGIHRRRNDQNERSLFAKPLRAEVLKSCRCRVASPIAGQILDRNSFRRSFLRHNRRHGTEIARHQVRLEMDKQFKRGKRQTRRAVHHSEPLVVPPTACFLRTDPAERSRDVSFPANPPNPHQLKTPCSTRARMSMTSSKPKPVSRRSMGAATPRARFEEINHSRPFSSVPSTSVAEANTRASRRRSSDSAGLRRAASFLRRAAVRFAIRSELQITSSLKFARSRNETNTENGNPSRMIGTKSNSVSGEPMIVGPPR